VACPWRPQRLPRWNRATAQVVTSRPSRLPLTSGMNLATLMDLAALPTVFTDSAASAEKAHTPAFSARLALSTEQLLPCRTTGTMSAGWTAAGLGAGQMAYTLNAAFVAAANLRASLVRLGSCPAVASVRSRARASRQARTIGSLCAGGACSAAGPMASSPSAAGAAWRPMTAFHVRHRPVCEGPPPEEVAHRWKRQQHRARAPPYQQRLPRFPKEGRSACKSANRPELQ